MPKDLLYGELEKGAGPRGRPNLRFKDICKRDLKALNINSKTWEALTANREAWRYTVQVGLEEHENSLRQAMRSHRKSRS